MSYFGTPVALLSTVAADGTPDTAPMSSVFWLGRTAVLGMGTRSQTARNLQATGECVINLPSVDLAAAVDALALTTARNPVPPVKAAAGYRHEADKLRRAGLHARRALTVRADRIDPDRWRPLVMSFQRFYGLGPEVHPSRLVTIDEEWYR